MASRGGSGARWVHGRPWLWLVVVGALIGVMLPFHPVAAVGLLLAIGLVLVVGRWPVVTFCAVALLYVASQAVLAGVSIGSLGSLSLNGAQLLVGGLSALMVLRLMFLAATRRDLRVAPFLAPVVLLLLSAGVGVLLAPDRKVAVAPVGRLAAYLLALVFMYYMVRGRRDLNVLLGTTLLASFISSSTAVVNYVVGYTSPALRAGAFRVAGSLGSWGPTAAVTLLGVPVLYGMYVTSRSRHVRLSVAIGFAVLGLGFFATFRRAAILALLLYAFLSLLSRSRGRGELSLSQRIALVGVGLAAVVVGVLLVDETTLEARVQDIPGVGAANLTDPSVGSGRMLIWAGIVRGLGENDIVDWIVGNGIYASVRAVERFSHVTFVAHNSYLELLYNQGLFGLLSYLFVVVVVYRALGRAERNCPAVAVEALLWRRMLLVYCVTLAMFSSAIYFVAAEMLLYGICGAILGVASQEGRTGAGDGAT